MGKKRKRLRNHARRDSFTIDVITDAMLAAHGLTLGGAT
jgi:hypothetical protein